MGDEYTYSMEKDKKGEEERLSPDCSAPCSISIPVEAKDFKMYFIFLTIQCFFMIKFKDLVPSQINLIVTLQVHLSN